MTVERGNTVLDIPETEKEKFLAQGFSVVDNKGNIIERGEPMNGSLRKEYHILKDENEELKSENEKLKTKIAKLQKDIKKLKKG